MKTARHKKGGMGGGATTREQPTARRATRKKATAHREPRSARPTKQTTHSAKAQATRGLNQRKQETKEARKEQQRSKEKKEKKAKGGRRANKGPRKGQPQPGGGRAKQKDKAAKGKGEAHQSAPGRPASPTRRGRTSKRTHATDPGVASTDPQGEVSASGRNSLGAPDESPVERQKVQETQSVSDRVLTRQPPQRTEPKTYAGGTRQGQPHRRATNGYDAERAQRPCLGGV